jgi:hypothetical protein
MEFPKPSPNSPKLSQFEAFEIIDLIRQFPRMYPV